MNDFSEIENELKKLRPARPSPVLFERIGEALAKDRRASVSDARGWQRWSWRFTEWSGGRASDKDGQLVRARERKRASQTPYKFGMGLAAAAVLVLFAIVTMERRHGNGEQMAQVTRAPETGAGAILNGIERSKSPNEFIPAGATQVVYNERDEGLQFADGVSQPLRRLRYQTHQTWQWRNPNTGASLRVSYPSEEVVLIPVSGQ